MGLIGPTGNDGAMGPSGSTGPSGNTGATGASGNPGPAGPTGAIGPAGPQGPAGGFNAGSITGTINMCVSGAASPTSALVYVPGHAFTGYSDPASGNFMLDTVTPGTYTVNFQQTSNAALTASVSPVTVSANTASNLGAIDFGVQSDASNCGACGVVCLSGQACVGGSCQGAGGAPNGTLCTSASACSSGFCVSGYCCNSACTTLGSACSFALTGQPNGICAPASAGVCNPSTCSGGCCSGGVCVAGTSNAACGSTGAACANCTGVGSGACNAGVCQ